ncbi:MAG: hypothetical protein HQ508_07460 [Candidatus Marinimicrobia bacterium]|nr:hypothetical protein [Candidatus Neomarinimicrobiota bacterium]
MKLKLSHTTIILLLLSVTTFAEDSLSVARYADLPQDVYQNLVNSDFFTSYDIYRQIDPFVKYGDFNGDGITDFAIQIVNKNSQKRGIIFLHSNDQNQYLIGAGRNFASIGDNFSWLNWWRIDAQTLMSEALLLKHPDFPRSLVYFDGKSYQFKSMDATTNYSEGPVYGLDIPQCLLRIPGHYSGQDL